MKQIECTCGFTITDKADGAAFKARYIPDMLWDDLWTKIDHAIEKTPNDVIHKEVARMSLRYLDYFRSIFQCPHCGEFYIENENREIKKVSSVEVMEAVFNFRSAPKTLEQNIQETWKSKIHTQFEDPEGDVIHNN